MTRQIPPVVRRRVVYPLLRRFFPVQWVRANGRRVFADLRDSVIGRLLFLDGHYEQALGDVIGGLRPHVAGHWALDIGANIGLHTLALSEAVGINGQVLAFEPEPRNGDMLLRTLATAKVKNVILERAAVGEREGHITMRISPDNFGDHRVAGPAESGALAVRMTTIDAAVAALCIPDGAIRFVKLDVQGYELHALRGMRRTLAANPDVVIAVEAYDSALRGVGSSAAQLVEELRALGFDGWELHADRVIPIAASPAYRLMRGDASADLLVARAAEPLASVLQTLYSNDIAPASRGATRDA